MNLIKLKFLFGTAKRMANLLLKDKKNVLTKVQEGVQKAIENKGALDGIWEQLQLLFSISRDYASGAYTVIPKGSIVAIFAGLLYFISPLDLIPDLLPGLGFVDDAYILRMVFKQVAKDLERYKKWKKAGENIISI